MPAKFTTLRKNATKTQGTATKNSFAVLQANDDDQVGLSVPSLSGHSHGTKPSATNPSVQSTTRVSGLGGSDSSVQSRACVGKGLG